MTRQWGSTTAAGSPAPPAAGAGGVHVVVDQLASQASMASSVASMSSGSWRPAPPPHRLDGGLAHDGEDASGRVPQADQVPVVGQHLELDRGSSRGRPSAAGPAAEKQRIAAARIRAPAVLVPGPTAENHSTCTSAAGVGQTRRVAKHRGEGRKRRASPDALGPELQLEAGVAAWSTRLAPTGSPPTDPPDRCPTAGGWRGRMAPALTMTSPAPRSSPSAVYDPDAATVEGHPVDEDVAADHEVRTFAPVRGRRRWSTRDALADGEATRLRPRRRRGVVADG